MNWPEGALSLEHESTCRLPSYSSRRPLEDGEILREGDEYWNWWPHHSWRPVAAYNHGKPARAGTGYRRRVS